MSDPRPQNSERKGILAGGNFITDQVKLIDAYPAQDTLASISSESMANGGGPYNVLKDLALLAPDLPLEACGLVGADPNGQWIREDCAASRIDTTQLHETKEAATSYTDAMTVASDGRRTFFHQRGANALLAPEHFDFSQTRARVFLLGYLMLLDTLDELHPDGTTGSSRVLKKAREAGLVAAVDCVSTPHPQFREIVLASARVADLLFLNEFEIGQVLGREVAPERAPMEEAALALSSECEAQIILHATAGAVVARQGSILGAQASLKLPEDWIVGATGAGDAFSAGFLLGHHEGEDTATCLRYAACSAAQSLTAATPSEGLRSLQDCLELTTQHETGEF